MADETRIDSMRIDYVALEDVEGADRNPKRHDYDEIRKAILRSGFRAPLSRDERTGKLVAGHGRLETLRRMQAAGEDMPNGLRGSKGRWLVPIICGMPFKNETEAEAFIVADNRISALGGWDTDGLNEILLEQIDLYGSLDGLGFSEDDLMDLADSVTSMPLIDDDAEAPEDTACTHCNGDGCEACDPAQLPDINDETNEADDGHEPEVTEPEFADGDTIEFDGHTIHCGDCVEVLKQMPDNSIDSIVCDPPYGMSAYSKQANAIKQISEAFSDVNFPKLYEFDSKCGDLFDLDGVPIAGSDLRGESWLGVDSGIGVPESTVDLDDPTVSESEVDAGKEPPGSRVADTDLPSELDPPSGEFLGNYIFEARDGSTSTGNVLGGCVPELFFSGFSVPVFAPEASSLSAFGCRSFPVIIGDDGVGLNDHTFGDAESSAPVVTLPRAVNRLMLRFDGRGCPLELFATSSAVDGQSLGTSGGPQLVRALSTASSLSTVAKPHRVSFVFHGADGTLARHWFNLWLPLESRIEVSLPSGGFMGKVWDATLPDPETWRQCLRVLKPGGHIISFASTRTVHRLGVAIEDAGFEIRDTINWLYWTGFPKSMNVAKAIDGHLGADREVISTSDQRVGVFAHSGSGTPQDIEDYSATVTANATDEAKQWDGWGTALKPAQEPAILARKPVSEKTLVANVLEHGTGGLNIDACRIAPGDTSWPGPQGGPAGTQCPDFPEPCKGHKSDGKYGDTFHAVTDTIGRFPANIYVCPKPPRSEKEAGLEDFAHASAGEVTGGRKEGSDGLNSPRAGAGRTSGSKNIHPTVKPVRLMRWLIRLVTPEHGLVLDTFLGSGTTMVAAQREGFNCVGIELDPMFATIAKARVEHAIDNRE